MDVAQSEKKQNETRESLSAMYTAWILCIGLLIVRQIAVEKIWMTNQSDFGSSEFKGFPRWPCYSYQAEMAQSRSKRSVFISS